MQELVSHFASFMPLAVVTGLFIFFLVFLGKKEKAKEEKEKKEARKNELLALIDERKLEALAKKGW